MESLITSLAARICMGAGLAGLSGIRVFFPVIIVSICAKLNFLGFDLEGTPLAVLESLPVMGLLAVLTVLEIVVNKIPRIESPLRNVEMPLSALAGAVCFGATLANRASWLVLLGLVVGAGIGLLSRYGYNGLTAVAVSGGASTIVSVFWDLVSLIGSFLTILLAYIGALVALFVIFVVYRVQQRRRRKYKGLRILKD